LQILHAQSLIKIKNVFAYFKAFKPQKWAVFVFIERPFLLPSVHHSFEKLERILTLMIRKAK
jgi:hypothetical protein